MRTFFLLALACLVLLLVVGFMDYTDAKIQATHYCHMVELGAWPDYKGVYHECF